MVERLAEKLHGPGRNGMLALSKHDGRWPPINRGIEQTCEDFLAKACAQDQDADLVSHESGQLPGPDVACPASAIFQKQGSAVGSVANNIQGIVAGFGVEVVPQFLWCHVVQHSNFHRFAEVIETVQDGA